MIHDPSDGGKLYQRIAEDIRLNILNGVYHPGDRLPPIRDLTQRWNCTQGTIQRAYRELALQGLVICRSGVGTHVANQVDYQRLQGATSLRKAKLIHHAEEFLLESLIAGFSYEEIEESIRLARRNVQTPSR